MKIAKKREAGKKLYRDGIAERIIKIAADIANGSYKNAIEKAGQISVLVDAATFDDYWSEKASLGVNRESNILYDLNRGYLSKDDLTNNANPYKPKAGEE